jgi:hypothetical protein
VAIVLHSAHTAGASRAATERVLYDGSLGTLPADQGMVFLGVDLVGPDYEVEFRQSYAGDGAQLDTTVDYEDYAGYSSTTATLDRQKGVDIRFTVQITREDHTTSGTADKNGDQVADRAGFSVIAISSDGQWGIELGFWEDQVWAQEGGNATDLFTHAEGVGFDTSGLNVYTLTLWGEHYTLTADNGPILSGRLRDYTAFSGFIDPYETADLLFLGDDTASASAEIKLTSIVVIEETLTGGHQTHLPLVTVHR